jgi:hypothetical protein
MLLRPKWKFRKESPDVNGGDDQVVGGEPQLVAWLAALVHAKDCDADDPGVNFTIRLRRILDNLHARSQL